MYRKYNNKKTLVDGIKFDSKREADRYIYLKDKQKTGSIKDLELQPSFVLQEGFKKNGTTYRAITYKADFKYFDIDRNKVIVEDSKGMKTDVYKLKKKLFEQRYEDLEIEEV